MQPGQAMADPALPCSRTEELAPELALGLVTGPERAEALVHVSRCSSCQAAVEDLAEVADELLALAPPAEPPPGFESSVVADVHEARRATADARSTVGRRRLVLAAAAVLSVVLAVGAVVGRATAPERGATRELAMVSPDGREVGALWVHDGPPTWLLVSVPEWKRWEGNGASTGEHDGAASYRMRLDLVDGGRTEIVGVTLASGGMWSTTTPLDPEHIRAVSIVDDTGRVWCTALLA